MKEGPRAGERSSPPSRSSFSLGMLLTARRIILSVWWYIPRPLKQSFWDLVERGCSELTSSSLTLTFFFSFLPFTLESTDALLSPFSLLAVHTPPRRDPHHPSSSLPSPTKTGETPLVRPKLKPLPTSLPALNSPFPPNRSSPSKSTLEEEEGEEVCFVPSRPRKPSRPRHRLQELRKRSRSKKELFPRRRRRWTRGL